MSIILIAPKIFFQFSCIGGECPDSCCDQGWNITFTKEEAERVCDRLHCETDRYFVGNDYMTVKTDKSRKCLFHNDKGLCMIHKDLGAEYLSYTCRQYPRISRSLGNVVISSLRPTCYEVMSRLLSDGSCMQISEAVTDEQLEVIITEKQEVRQRFTLFRQLSDIFYSSNTIDNALSETAKAFGAEKFDVKPQFYEKYGFEIITSDKAAPQKYVRNIVLAMLFEWMITGIKADKSVNENISDFIFSAGAVSLAANGAFELCKERSELICTLTDFLNILK